MVGFPVGMRTGNIHVGSMHFAILGNQFPFRVKEHAGIMRPGIAWVLILFA